MNITKEELRSLIREQMSNVSEVADDDASMMPAKPVDVPFSVLAAGGRVARDEATKAYEPGSKELELAMMVINMAEKQDQQKAKDEEPMSAKDRLSYMWDFDKRSHPDPSGVETTNPFKFTKENLERIIKEELAIALEGYKGPARRAAEKNRDDLKRAVAKSPMRQGRLAARAGGPKKYPEDFTEKQKKSFDNGWDDEKSIMADEKKMKGESLEKTSINEQ